MPKYSPAERSEMKNIVATLSLKRIPEKEIINEIYTQTNKTLYSIRIFYVKKTIKKESAKWYKTMREGEYEYIHEFKERINEIMDLQKKHHKIVDSPIEPTPVKQASLIELHRLNVTLSNYFDVAPTYYNNNATLSITSENKTATYSVKGTKKLSFNSLYLKPFWIWDKFDHRLEHSKTMGNCCFNHIVGLPTKNGIEHPMYDYEKLCMIL